MELSHYLKTFPCRDDPDSLIVFSTRRISKIRIPGAIFERIGRGELSLSEEMLLTKLGMLVSDREDEKKTVRDMFGRLNARNSGLDVIVVLNLDCNFSCVYCYEGAPEGDRYMSAQTADRLIAFIQRKFAAGKKSLVLDFYGGEPLLSIGLIEHISKALKFFTRSLDAEFSFTLVTNGSLFRRAVAERLVPLGLKSVKITLDGPSQLHNRYRPFKSGAGSFDSIVKNIKETCDIVKIGIGGNYDETSWPGFPSLLDFLEANGLTPDILYMVKFDPIFRPVNQKHLLAKYHGGCASGHEPWILEAEGVLRREILRRGYFTPRVRPILCAIENKSSYVVNFDGRLYKCPAFAGHEEFAIGDVDGEQENYEQRYRVNHWKNEVCLDCVYLPLCFGGCRYISFLKDGAIKAVDCKRPYLDSALETLVNQEIEFLKKS
ncbi:MAG: geopeptide radical SAM maturase [Pseudomonadota bacterium]